MVPGEHSLWVEAANPDTGEVEAAEMQVTLTGSDVDGLTLATAPGARLSGRIRFDPDVDPGFRPSTLAISGDRSDNVGRIGLLPRTTRNGAVRGSSRWRGRTRPATSA